jgi:hypothetical protein
LPVLRGKILGMITIIDPPSIEKTQAVEALEVLAKLYSVRIELSVYMKYGTVWWIIRAMNNRWKGDNFTKVCRDAGSFIFKAYEGQKSEI